MNFQAIRKEYEDKGIDPADLNDCPLQQLQLWITDATENSPGPWFESNVMSLGTSGADGKVGVRYVLLKGITSVGIQFFTNYDSAKGQQLAENANCSVAMHWPYLGRQIRISGTAEKTDREVSEKYFHSRPRGAQLGAAISNQSTVITSRDELQQRLDQLQAEIGDGPVPLPDYWGGYLIKPDEFEFWQGRTNRLHDRIVYRGQAGNWQKVRLSP